MSRWDDPTADPVQDWARSLQEAQSAATEAFRATPNSEHYKFIFRTHLFGKNYTWYKNMETGQVSLHRDLEESE